MMKWDWKEWAMAALIRAIRTFAEVFASGITVGMLWSEINWLHVLSASAVGFVYSIALALTGLPEVGKQQPPDDPDDEVEE